MPDYHLQAKSVKDVQQALRFASEYNVCLSIITTGHDQLMHSDADSRLLLDLSLF
jgi:predicted metal-dependent HD superfamily phosphohydrolase